MLPSLSRVKWGWPAFIREGEADNWANLLYMAPLRATFTLKQGICVMSQGLKFGYLGHQSSTASISSQAVATQHSAVPKYWSLPGNWKHLSCNTTEVHTGWFTWWKKGSPQQGEWLCAEPWAFTATLLLYTSRQPMKPSLESRLLWCCGYPSGIPECSSSQLPGFHLLGWDLWGSSQHKQKINWIFRLHLNKP